MPTTEPAPGARARVRAALTQEIKDTARRQLATTGSAGLSLRAVAREMGMASSAVYRYFPSRDELLTALIVDAYEAIAQAAQDAEVAVRRTDLAGRWLAVARGARGWALAHPQEYALIFGSPVPGYAAPQATVDAAARIPVLLLAIMTDAVAAGTAGTAKTGASAAEGAVSARHRSNPPMPRVVRADMKALIRSLELKLDEPQLARGVLAWTQLIGSISFELFGHLHNVIEDYDAYFDFQLARIGYDLGL